MVTQRACWSYVSRVLAGGVLMAVVGAMTNSQPPVLSEADLSVGGMKWIPDTTFPAP